MQWANYPIYAALINDTNTYIKETRLLVVKNDKIIFPCKIAIECIGICFYHVPFGFINHVYDQIGKLDYNKILRHIHLKYDIHVF